MQNETVNEPKNTEEDKIGPPPKYGIIQYDLAYDQVEEFTGYYDMKVLKKDLETLTSNAVDGEIFFLVDIRAIVVPPQIEDEEEEDDEEFTLQEKEDLSDGVCPNCKDILRWDEVEEMWICDSCEQVYEPKYVSKEIPVVISDME